MSKEKKLSLFIDTDLDWDDYIAIIYLLNSPNVEILGLSITGCGAVYLK
ncbi:MAG: hypothetical protein HRK26_05035 [Rickettsiaceae bacterium H1]|nr:hypothetical protein [Rickettsiaceae bacterium H1]